MARNESAPADDLRQQSPASSGSSIGLGDIYYVLFKHKWKIIVCGLAGIAAAFGVYKLQPPPFLSEAKLFIRYVPEKQPLLAGGADDVKYKTPDRMGETIINTEVEILRSFDLAQQVALAVGPNRILGVPADQASANQAANAIRKALTVEAPRNSSVLTVDFRHKDPELTQAVLNQTIEAYLKRHTQIHRSASVGDLGLAQETDQLRARLNQTEEELRKMLESVGVLALEDAKRIYADRTARLQQSIMDTEAELAERRASLSSMTGSAPTSENPTPPAEVPPEKVTVYRQITGQLQGLIQQEQELLTRFTPGSQMVQRVRTQISEYENLKVRLEKEYPQLLVQSVTRPSVAGGPPSAPIYDVAAETARIRALESRFAVLKEQLDRVHTDSANLSEHEAMITELQRRKELLEKQYRYLAENRERDRIDQELDTGRIRNISVLQAPSPPMRDIMKVAKLMLMVAIGLFGVGIGTAFGLEFFLDQTVKRAGEIESRFGLPVVLAIPEIKTKAARMLPGSLALKLLGSPTNAKSPSKGVAAGELKGTELAASRENGELRTFFDALRNRLVYNFEMRNITRKPKLVAVTSCGSDSGVSTIAAGLASSLSETGDGNVLLVDMNPDRKSPLFFHQGNLTGGLDDVLDSGTRDDALVRENLYVVSPHSSEERLSWVLPKRFASLIPKMKASDFDYIIFDMPPVSQISATPQLTRFMDQTLLVVESEKTARESVQRAGAMLADAGANVGIVINKTRSYVPAMLDPEASS